MKTLFSFENKAFSMQATLLYAYLETALIFFKEIIHEHA